MKLKILSIILWICIFPHVYADEIADQIDKCVKAQTGNKQREIEDFICIQWTKEKIAYQIILDKRLKEIDEKIEKQISDLEENKWYYFWKDKQKSYIDAVQNIINTYNIDGEFWIEYYKVCNSVHEEVITYLPPSVQFKNAAWYFAEESNTCYLMTFQKLAIYKQVSYDLLLLNKLQVSKDEKKLYQQEERTKYDWLLSKFTVNIWYVERIWAKWPSKIKNTSWG